MTVSIEHQGDLADGYERESVYVAMQDGCRIAVDVLHPAKGGQRLDGALPTVLHATPYRRSFVITGLAKAPAVPEASDEAAVHVLQDRDYHGWEPQPGKQAPGQSQFVPTPKGLQLCWQAIKGLGKVVADTEHGGAVAPSRLGFDGRRDREVATGGLGSAPVDGPAVLPQQRLLPGEDRHAEADP